MNAAIDDHEGDEPTEINSKPNFLITAYIITDERGTNEKSVRVLEAAGFTERGGLRYDDDAPQEDRLFILDWDKLDTILKDTAEPQLPFGQ